MKKTASPVIIDNKWETRNETHPHLLHEAPAVVVSNLSKDIDSNSNSSNQDTSLCQFVSKITDSFVREFVSKMLSQVQSENNIIQLYKFVNQQIKYLPIQYGLSQSFESVLEPILDYLEQYKSTHLMASQFSKAMMLQAFKADTKVGEIQRIYEELLNSTDHPLYCIILNQLSLLYALQKQDISKAMQLAQESIDKNPQFSLNYLNRASILCCSLNQQSNTSILLNQIVENVEMAIQCDPQNSLCYAWRSFLLRSLLQQHHLALLDLNRAIELDYLNCELYWDRCQLLLSMGVELEQAFHDYELFIYLSGLYNKEQDLLQMTRFSPILQSFTHVMNDNYDKALSLIQ